MGKKKKNAAAAKTIATAARAARRAAREERKMAKSAKENKVLKRAKEVKKRERKTHTADMWAVPAPSHLVARLEVPKHKSKYHSYFEFAENTEKKKRLEFKVTDNSNPPPGFKFVPIGDPTLTNACKELSREKDAMIFIVSGSKEENSKISEHIYRTGYHFRESIVDEARDLVGEVTISIAADGSAKPEPIPESQEDINKQADGAIRDLFPRIPNTDRQKIIEHAFQKGAVFHGEPTVGLQPDIPLSRRVQLAVLAHIRHTHTRYDQLLRETTWMNARKVVEPVCLDFIVKWRGDEETGRDQMDEILREVVIITDSEESDESSEEDDSSDEEGEATSASSASLPQLASRDQNQSVQQQNQVPEPSMAAQRKHNRENEMPARSAVSSQDQPKANNKVQRDKRMQRGFKRYQAAWDDAVHRIQAPETATAEPAFEDPMARRRQQENIPPIRNQIQYPTKTTSETRVASYGAPEQTRHNDLANGRRPEPHYLQQRTAPGMFPKRDEVITRPQAERSLYYQDVPPRLDTPSQRAREYRLPPVVRRPPSRVLQDMLVPSIETGSSDALTEPSLPDARRDVYGDFNQAPYPRRMIERRRQSPDSRQVILISDDSPQPKRRRVVHDDPGYSRPLISHDQTAYSAAPYAESHLIPASSTQSGGFPVHNPRNPGQLSQGLLRHTQQSLSGPSGERIPIYDAPAESGYLPAIHSRRAEFEVGPSHQREVPSGRQISPPRPLRDSVNESIYARRPVAEDQRMMERGQVIRLKESDFDPRNQTQRPLSPCFPVSSRVSRSYETGRPPVYADQAFMQNSSQSRLDPPLSNPRDDTNLVTERPRHSFTRQEIISPRFEDPSARSFTSVHHARDTAAVQYVDKPLYRQEHRREPILYEQDRPQTYESRYAADRPMTIIREQPHHPPGDTRPTFVRTMPRREIITLD